MTPAVAELLARKQRLLERRQVEFGLSELDDIERLLVRINIALNSLDGTPIETSEKRLGEAADARPAFADLIGGSS